MRSEALGSRSRPEPRLRRACRGRRRCSTRSSRPWWRSTASARWSTTTAASRSCSASSRDRWSALPGARLFPGAEARWLKGASREARDFKLEAEGRELTLKAESLPIRDEDGDSVGSVVLAEAISETEDGEFQKKIDRLVSLGELSAYVAHEIRNPLTGIRTTVQFVGSKLKPQRSAARGPRRRDQGARPDRADHHRPADVRAPAGRAARSPATSTRCSTRRSTCSSSSSATRR